MIIIVYVYLNLKLFLELRFLKKVLLVRNLNTDSYTGFLIIAENDFIINEIPSFMKICGHLNKVDNSCLVDFSNGKGADSLDFNSLEKFNIEVMPSIIYMVNGKIIHRYSFFDKLLKGESSMKSVIHDIKRVI